MAGDVLGSFENKEKGASSGFTPYQKFVIAVLAFLQFTIVLDFMVLSPVGAILMPALHITPAQFGLVVSAYAFSAGISGLLAAGFADRFDRKKLLLFFYTGFILGTLFCGLSPNYHFLLLARMVTGLFGGVIGSIVLAIAADLFPLGMRGRVMGIIQTAFSVTQVLGIPIALYFSNIWGWHAPFIMIVVISSAVGILIMGYLKPIRGHLGVKAEHSVLTHFSETLTNKRYIQAFATTALLTTGGYMMMPFTSAYNVHNLGVPIEKLPMIYMITGLCTMMIGPMMGKLSDTIGKFKVFCMGAILTVIMVTIYANLPPSSLTVVILVTVIMFIGISARIISSSALTSAVPNATHRGAFMAISASIQQFSGGVASALSGLIVTESATGTLEHFDVVGYIIVGTTVFTVVMMYFIDQYVHNRSKSA